MSYCYFVLVLDTAFILGKTEYQHFYLASLKQPFQIVTVTFIMLFIGLFFVKQYQQYTKWLWLAFIIACVVMFLVNNHYYNVLNHGQGG